MEQLSREAFERGRRFLETEARPLERALFWHRFEHGTAGGALAELARFQNDDGGFGHALEPDLRTPSSSALATANGLLILRELDTPPDHPMVAAAIAYLLATFDGKARIWPVVPAGANGHPHAPWWHEEDGSLARSFDGFRIIPRALILASLHHYAPLVPAEWLDALTEETVRTIETVEVLGEGGGSDLAYAVNLALARNLPQRYALRLEARIRKAIRAVVVRDPARWDSYCITPLKAVPSPGSIGADLIADALQAHLDYVVAHQSIGGTWDPVWTWAGTYPDAWKEARREWRGILTLETLTQLAAFGRTQGLGASGSSKACPPGVAPTKIQPTSNQFRHLLEAMPARIYLR